MGSRRHFLIALAGAAIAGSAHGADPPIRILVGFPAGGESDLIARLVADRIRTSLGTALIVENKPGASGAIAAEALKNAHPDGRTLLVSPIASTVFAPLTHAHLRYDPIRHFAPVSLAAHFPMALAVGPACPARTLDEYLRWARDHPSMAVYGVPLAGGPTHFFGVMLARAAGVDLTVVPYKGSAALTADLVAGHVPAAVTVLSQLVQLQQDGTVRVLATSGASRSASTGQPKSARLRIRTPVPSAAAVRR